MAELINCPKCGAIFTKNPFRDVCPNCWKKEEEDFDTVYHFMRKRENRAATMEQVVEQTGVEEELILKFIKKGRIQLKQFPNLGYPCDRCGRIIHTGKLCEKCQREFRNDLEAFKNEEQRRRELHERENRTYHSQQKD